MRRPIFIISYCRSDSIGGKPLDWFIEFVLYSNLRNIFNRGEFYFDGNLFNPGNDMPEKFEQCYNRANIVFVFLSKNYLDKINKKGTQIHKEFQLILGSDRNKLIIPIFLDGIDLSYDENLKIFENILHIKANEQETSDMHVLTYIDKIRGAIEEHLVKPIVNTKPIERNDHYIHSVQDNANKKKSKKRYAYIPITLASILVTAFAAFGMRSEIKAFVKHLFEAKSVPVEVKLPADKPETASVLSDKDTTVKIAAPLVAAPVLHSKITPRHPQKDSLSAVNIIAATPAIHTGDAITIDDFEPENRKVITALKSNSDASPGKLRDYLAIDNFTKDEIESNIIELYDKTNSNNTNFVALPPETRPQRNGMIRYTVRFYVWGRGGHFCFRLIPKNPGQSASVAPPQKTGTTPTHKHSQP